MPATGAKFIIVEVTNYCPTELRPPKLKLGYALPVIAVKISPSSIKPLVVCS